MRMGQKNLTIKLDYYSSANSILKKSYAFPLGFSLVFLADCVQFRYNVFHS